LTEDYSEGLRSNFADMANIAGRDGGASPRPRFLGKFTRGLSWAHMDIAGSAWTGGAAKGRHRQADLAGGRFPDPARARSQVLGARGGHEPGGLLRASRQ